MNRTLKLVSHIPSAFLCLCLLFTTTASAQQSEPINEQSQLATTSAALTEDEPGTDNHPPDSTEAEKSRRGSFVAAPIPTSSAALGAGVTIVAGYLFPLNKNDKISPPSVIGGAALITNNGTRAFAVGTELYFKEDRYHVLAGIAHGDLNYDFYGTGYRAGSAGIKFGLNQKGTAFFGEIMRRIGWQIFVGPRVWMGRAELAPQHLNENHPELPPLNVSFEMRAIGLKVERDTTPNRFYPTKGTMLHFSSDFFSKGLGGSFTFQTYRLTFNSYHSFGNKQVLAYNVFMCTTGGQAPFFGECIFGMQNELRGYPAGRYIDRKMFATQLEYRRQLIWRLGVVAFGGAGEVAPSLSKFSYDNILPSVGAGARFNLSTKYHVNLRADIAQGKDGHTFTMGIGEAF